MADDIIPYAADTYRSFEKLFDDQFYYSTPILRLFDSVKAQNDWSVRCNSPEYSAYVNNSNVIHLDKQKIKNDFGAFEINGGSKLETGKFLDHYRNFLLSQNKLLNEQFEINELQISGGAINYRNIKARKIIFCEGAYAFQNPYFKFLPFQFAKGEALIIKIEDFYPDKIINGEVFLMPSDKANEYYVGATHDWTYDDEKPSIKGKQELEANLKSVITCPYEIIGQKAAIRPTVKDRRPFIGFHRDYTNVGIFNGMGTKGISLSPYFARHFADHLVKGGQLLKEVDIKRFL